MMIIWELILVCSLKVFAGWGSICTCGECELMKCFSVLVRSLSLRSLGDGSDRMCNAVPAVVWFIQSVLARVTKVDQLADARNIHVCVESLTQVQIENIVIRQVLSCLYCDAKLDKVNFVSCVNRKISE